MNKLSREYAMVLAKEFLLKETWLEQPDKNHEEEWLEWNNDFDLIVKGYMACAEHARNDEFTKSLQDALDLAEDEIKQLKSNIALGNTELEQLSIEFNTLEHKIKQLREENERLSSTLFENLLLFIAHLNESGVIKKGTALTDEVKYYMETHALNQQEQ